MNPRLLLSLSAVLVLSLALSAQVVVRGPYLQSATPTSIVVCWRTDVPADSRVTWGTAFGAQTAQATDANQATEHFLPVTGLSPATTYFYSLGTTTAILAGGSADYSFTTPPVAGTEKKIHAWILGDSGTANSNARAVRDSYYAYNGSRKTDFWLMLGDNAYTTGTDAEFQNAVFSNMYESMLRSSCLWPTPGNHDEQSANSALGTGPYYDIFRLPTAAEAGGMASGTEAYYSFDFGDVHFISLCSSTTDPNFYAGMLAWLSADLASTNARWLIAFWHHPPYSDGSHFSDTSVTQTAMRQYVNPLLEAAGVDLVLCGHSHSYERSMFLDGHYGLSTTFNPQTMAVDQGDGQVSGTGAYRKSADAVVPHTGAVYVVEGCSGSVQAAPLMHPVMVASRLELGSMILDIDGPQLDLRFLTDQGTISDHVSIVKGPATAFERHIQPIPPFSTWSYESSGQSLFGTNWEQPGYNDSAWAQGPGILGYGETYIQTTIPAALTAYFRKQFTLTIDPSGIERAIAWVAHDDGCVLYLNGVEVGRPFMPSGPVTYATFALNHEFSRYTPVDITPYKALLHPGQNTLAVEVHQTSVTSTDFVFDLHMTLDVQPSFFDNNAARGAVGDALAQHSEPLTVNGSTGGALRSVEAPYGLPITIAVAQPATNPSPADFAIFGRLGDPSPSELLSAGAIGTFLFTPQLLDAGNPQLFFLTSSYAPDPTMLVPATAAPWNFTVPGGINGDFVFVLQGIMTDAPGQAHVTNAIRVHTTP